MNFKAVFIWTLVIFNEFWLKFYLFETSESENLLSYYLYFPSIFLLISFKPLNRFVLHVSLEYSIKLDRSRFRELAWRATISHVTAHSSSVTAGSNISPFPAVAPAQWLCDSEVKVRLFLPRLWEQKPAYFLVPVLDSTEMGHIVLTLNKKQKCLICLLQEINTCSWKRRLEPTERAYLSRLMSCSSGSIWGKLTRNQ